MQDNTLIPPSETHPLYITLTKVTDAGTIPNHRIATGHTIQGWITSLPEVGHIFRALRTVTNGREALGWFTTSLVVSTEGFTREGGTFSTRNSTYRVGFHPEEEFSLDLGGLLS